MDDKMKNWVNDCIEKIEEINSNFGKSLADVIAVLVSKNPTELGYSREYIKSILEVTREFADNQYEYGLSPEMRRFMSGNIRASKIWGPNPNGNNHGDDER